MKGSMGLTRPNIQLDIFIYVMLLTSKYAKESYERVLAYKPNHHINHKVFSICFSLYLFFNFSFNCYAYH